MQRARCMNGSPRMWSGMPQHVAPWLHYQVCCRPPTLALPILPAVSQRIGGQYSSLAQCNPHNLYVPWSAPFRHGRWFVYGQFMCMFAGLMQNQGIPSVLHLHSPLQRCLTLLLSVAGLKVHHVRQIIFLPSVSLVYPREDGSSSRLPR